MKEDERTYALFVYLEQGILSLERKDMSRFSHLDLWVSTRTRQSVFEISI